MNVCFEIVAEDIYQTVKFSTHAAARLKELLICSN